MYWQSFTSILLVLSLSYILGLGALVYLRNRFSSINRIFAIFALNIACWIVSVLLLVNAQAPRTMLLLAPWTFASSVFIPANFLLFVLILARRKLPPIKPAAIFYLVATLLAILALSSNLILKFEIEKDGRVFAVYSSVLYLYAAYFIITLGGILYYLASATRKQSGLAKLQFQYVFTGTLISSVCAVFSGILAPLLGYRTMQLAASSPACVLILASFIAYAVVKYNLMDITVVIKKTTQYALLTVIITAVYIFLVLISNLLFGELTDWKTLTPAMIAALLIAFAFAPLKEGIQAFVDRSIFKKRYDHRRILGDLSQILTAIFRLDDLLKATLKMITGSMGIERGIVYIRQNDSRFYPSARIDPGTADEAPILLTDDDPLIRVLEQVRRIIILQPLDRFPPVSRIREAVLRLQTLKYEIIVPILRKERLIAVLLASRKITGDAYTREDIEMFSTLAPHLAVAIENARLYTQVQESNIYQESLLDNLTSGVIAADTASVITVFNRKAEEILEIPAERVLGSKSEVLPPQLHEALRKAWSEQQRSSSDELTLKLASGKETPLAVSLSIFRGSDGHCLGVLALLTDLTEKKNLESEIRRSDRLALLGTLAAGMAHEIKNPLVSLKTYFQLLPEKYSEKEFQTNFAGLAVKEVDRINRLVEQLLNYARPSSSRRFNATDVREVLESTLLFINNRLEKQQIVLEKDIPDLSMTIQGDGEQLKQVFLNIIINSLQAMAEKGILKIKISLLTSPGQGYDCLDGPGYKHRKNGDWVIVEISDSGSGIDQKDIPHLFDPFFSTKEDGSGLGLAIADSIINEHGGTILVRSRLGAGSTFSIVLPSASQTEASK